MSDVEAAISARVVVSYEEAILQEVALEKAVTVIGRHPGCDIVIDHPAVSGRHVLLRVVDRTVYAEDLASTNGTQVNGVAINTQVIHHLDLLQVGKHKLHFFDDAMLVGELGGLERTVQTDFERTLMAMHVPSPRVARVQNEDLDLTRTLEVQRDASLSLAPQAAARAVDTAAVGAMALRVASGERAGELVHLERANTMIGLAGGDTALVVKRGTTYFLARFSGQRPPKLNRKELGPGTHALAQDDDIEVGGVSFRVVRP